MSYFSRLHLDASHPQAREALQEARVHDAYREHQWLWHFFPHSDGARRDFLFRRMDPQGDREQPLYYLVSARPPAASHPAWKVQKREYDPMVSAGDRFGFDLRVNPVVTRDGKRHDVVMDAKTAAARGAGLSAWKQLEPDRRPPETVAGQPFVEQRITAWLEGDGRAPGFAARHGFAIARGANNTLSLRVDGYRRQRLADKDRQSSRAWFVSVDLSGLLQVTDAELFRRALLNGVGHARAFGCGLLLVRRK